MLDCNPVRTPVGLQPRTYSGLRAGVVKPTAGGEAAQREGREELPISSYCGRGAVRHSGHLLRHVLRGQPTKKGVQ